MDFRHLIVTCLFSMLRLSFETQKIKENYAIFLKERKGVLKRMQRKFFRKKKLHRKALLKDFTMQLF